MRIVHNLPAMAAYNALNATGNQLNRTIQKLSTGLRINSAADDAAGLSISEKIRAQAGGLDVAMRNAQDGVSLLQTAEGGLTSSHSILHRMRELSVQAANDALTSNDRAYIQGEIGELKDEINRIANATQFNGRKLLDGSVGALWASDSPNTKAVIRGGLTSIDEFGQKVSAEGNYNIDITAAPGSAQVQKSNIMAISGTVKEFQTRAKVEYHIILNGGTNGEAVSNVKDAANKDELDSGWNFDMATKALTITDSGVYKIVGNGSAQVTRNHIVIAPGANVQLFIENVNIYNANSSAIEVKPGATLDLYLSGNNRLTGGNGRAGLEVPDGATLILSSADGDGATTGTLTSNGGNYGAGIGGPGINNPSGRAGTITINGGTVTAVGQYGAAGIGGGNTYYTDGGGTITINAGVISATGGSRATGIGSGIIAKGDSFYNNGNGEIGDDGTVINIAGGKITAVGANGSPGIGGGDGCDSGTINIRDGMMTDGSITATVGAGKNGREGAIDLNSTIAPVLRSDVPSIPRKTVKTPATVYDEVVTTVTHEIVTGEEEVLVDVEKPKKLTEIDRFYDASGSFMLSRPQTITIAQGDGRSAKVTLYAHDTMYDVAGKINDAIADGLGQGAYTDNRSKFCTIADGTDGTSESVCQREPVYGEPWQTNADGSYALDADGNRILKEPEIIGYKVYSTMLVRSAIPGRAGELAFSGDEDLLNTLGLNTIQEASESRYSLSVYDAHSGTAVASDVKTSGNMINSIIPPSVGLEFDPLAGINARWNEIMKRYELTGGQTRTTLHLVDNGMTFQVGANRGEGFLINLGDMSAFALGINGVNVTTRERAARSVAVLDRAIGLVSEQRARIGAYQNSLEHTTENLTTAMTNLTAAESRIRDADMASGMMEFVKLQILNQSGTSMLAQANQLPQQVLSLLQ